MERNRVPELDIVKGIAIILVVIGHTSVPGNNFIYLFHMAVFFIASGYLYSSKNGKSISALVQFVRRKLKSLWLPYFIGITIFTLLHNLFLKLNILTDNLEIESYVSKQYVSVSHYLGIKDIIVNITKAFVFSGNEQLAGTFWFFKTLFISSIMFCFIDFVIQKWIGVKSIFYFVIQGFISGIALICGRFFFLKGISVFGLARALTVYPLLYLGYLIKLKIRSERGKYGILAILSLVLLLICNNFVSIALDLNDCSNSIIFVVVSLSGWFLLYSIARILAHKKISKVLQKRKSWIRL